MGYTAGPWINYIGTNSIWAGKRAICVVTGSRKLGDVERKANAVLIAAAPDMLAALQGVLRVADRKTDEFDAAHAAIAKAFGAA